MKRSLEKFGVVWERCGVGMMMVMVVGAPPVC